MSHISTFIDPIPATEDGNPRLMLAILLGDGFEEEPRIMVGDSVGQLRIVPMSKLKIQHEYDFDHEIWVDRYSEAVEAMIKAQAEEEKKEGRRE